MRIAALTLQTFAHGMLDEVTSDNARLNRKPRGVAGKGLFKMPAQSAVDLEGGNLDMTEAARCETIKEGAGQCADTGSGIEQAAGLQGSV